MIPLHSEEEFCCLGGAEGRTHTFFRGKGRKKKEKKKSCTENNLLLLLNCFSSFAIPPDCPTNRQKICCHWSHSTKKGSVLLWQICRHIHPPGMFVCMYTPEVFCSWPIFCLSVAHLLLFKHFKCEKAGLHYLVSLAQTIGTSRAHINKILKPNQIFHSIALIRVLNVFQRFKTW